MANHNELAYGAKVYIGDQLCGEITEAASVPKYDRHSVTVECPAGTFGSSVKVVHEEGGLGICNIVVRRGEKYPTVLPEPEETAGKF